MLHRRSCSFTQSASGCPGNFGSASAWRGGNLPRHPPLYAPDLLGCGESDLPQVAYYPEDWAEQLASFLEQVVERPAVAVVQGASLAIALELVARYPERLCGLVLGGPPAWSLTTQSAAEWQQRLVWNVLASPLGNGFYRWARRREFLRSFSQRQLFGQSEAVDAEWLDELQRGADDPATRHAVFAFLAGFWRRDYGTTIAAIQQPTLVVMGDRASSISRTNVTETPEQRLQAYCKCLPNGRGVVIPGRNVLPYESTAEFVRVTAEFARQLTAGG
ncbi:alpha/beta fold hydrolase [Rubidibacter lacunae]|uniref:alpha/beta fold hydrolase n=1 Tax=Rubidibacter lacunae TaxID=582514 RepID=UPI0018DBC00A|nr:alpha/beta hydrolase [Rubidibacter lacunae]